MSVRLEWTTAAATRPATYMQGDELADGNVVTARYAIAIGTTIIEGHGLELLGLLEHAAATLQAAFSLRG